MNRCLLSLILIMSFFLKAEQVMSEPPSELSPAAIPVLTIDGAIGPAVSDYLVRAITAANQSINTPLVIITIDTPGGLSSSLRDINQAIMSSNVPIACLVYPQGARAASAGTYILYACHIAAMSSATTLGAATPVSIGAPKAPGKDDQQKPQSDTATAMEKKVLNDAIAYIRSLAQLRGRNQEWAVLAVKEAATLTANEALAENVIDLIAQSPNQLVELSHGKLVTIAEQVRKLDLSNVVLKRQQPDWRNHFIATITDPNIAYILMLIGVYGLLLEFYSPGIGIAGITGAISLFIALYAFQLLPINFAGAGLLILGIALMVAESFAPSFGVLGVGGLLSFILGSIFLIDSEQTDLRISIPLIAAIALSAALFLIFTLGMIWRTRKKNVVSGEEQIIGSTAIVSDDFNGHGYVLCNGERWAASCSEPLFHGDKVKVKEINGLTLLVNPPHKKE